MHLGSQRLNVLLHALMSAGISHEVAAGFCCPCQLFLALSSLVKDLIQGIARNFLLHTVYGPNTTATHMESAAFWCSKLACLCCRSRAASPNPVSQQTEGATTAQAASTPSVADLHPLAEAHSWSKSKETSVTAAGQATGSSRSAGLSEELLDLFESIDHLRQEVEALQEPQGLPHPSSP